MLSVVIDQSSLFNGFLDGRKVGISEDHISGEFGNVRSTTHCNTNIRLTKGRSIINAI